LWLKHNKFYMKYMDFNYNSYASYYITYPYFTGIGRDNIYIYICNVEKKRKKEVDTDSEHS